MSRSHSIAWAAGFFDGEGSVSIHAPQPKRGCHNLHISISQKVQEPLLEVQRLFGGKIYIKSDKGRAVGYQWNVGSVKAADMLRQMMPYLVHKNQVAALALDYQATMTNSRKKVPDEIIEKRRLIREEIIRLNSLS